MISLHRIKRSSQNKTEEKEFFHTYTERSVFATDSYVNINPCRQASLTTTLNAPPRLSMSVNKCISFAPFDRQQYVQRFCIFFPLFYIVTHHLDFR